MGAVFLHRFSQVVSPITFGTVLSTSTAFGFHQAGGGMVHITAGTGLTLLTWYACATLDGTYLPIKDTLGNAVTSVVGPNQACLIPAACFGAVNLKAVGNVAATATVTLKG